MKRTLALLLAVSLAYTPLLIKNWLWESKGARLTPPPAEDNGREWRTITCQGGDIYEGWTRDGVRQGFGVHTWKESGDSYYGMYQDGGRSGFGVYLCSNPSLSWHLYAGTWRNDKANGEGAILLKDGRRMTGLIQDDRFVSGQYHTVQYDPDTCYTQDLTFLGGIVYIGETDEKGRPDGYGVMRYPEGGLYAGHFRLTQREGYGIWVSADHKVQEGYWLSNEYVGGPGEDSAEIRQAKAAGEERPVLTPTPRPTEKETQKPRPTFDWSASAPTPTPRNPGALPAPQAGGGM